MRKPNPLTRMIEQRERDLLDRLCWQVRDTDLECKRGLADDLAPAITPTPAGLALCAAGGLLGAAALRSGDTARPFAEMSRRRFLGKGPVVAGGVVAGLLMTGETQEAEAAFWNFWGSALLGATRFVIREAFTSAIGWFVNRALDYWVAPYLRRGVAHLDGRWNVATTDVTFVKEATPTDTKFHNDFATTIEISNRDKHLKSQRIARHGVSSFGVGKYVQPYDANAPEMLQVQKETKSNRLKAGMLPTTRRSPLDLTRHGDAFRKVIAAYGFKPGDTREMYRDAWSDSTGNDYLGFGVEVGKSPKFLIARIRKV